jgi:hypothetical protein
LAIANNWAPFPGSSAFQYWSGLGSGHQQLGIISEDSPGAIMLAFNRVIGPAIIPIIPLCFLLPSSKPAAPLAPTDRRSPAAMFERRRPNSTKTGHIQPHSTRKTQGFSRSTGFKSRRGRQQIQRAFLIELGLDDKSNDNFSG